MNRRNFLKTSSAAALTLAAGPFILHAQSPARRYRTALIGCGWWGGNILREAMASGACQVTGLCDVDESQIEKTVTGIMKDSPDQPKRYRDYRELLAKEKPDIAIVATPDHWHALPAIAAAQAGAHVYVEKPIGHTVREGRAMVKAARDAGRVMQVGTHRRVSPHNVSGREFLRSGRAGKIAMARCFVLYGGSGPEKPQPNEEPPKGLDWDFWCGPAPRRPFNRKIHPRGFRQFLDYANGTLGDWGIHWLDQVLWVTGEKWPRKVFSTGGRPIKGKPVNDATGQTTDAPDHQVATWEFEQFTMQWEHRQFAGNETDKGENVGVYFYGTEGTFHMGWQKGWTFYPVQKSAPVLHEEPKLGQPDAQNIKELWADFLHAIQTGRKPVSDIEELHWSTNCALLGMLSMKLGRSLAWDGAKETVIGDPEANQLLSRPYRGPWTYPQA